MTLFLKGDALAILRQRPSASVDLIYTDPPFGTTGHQWDESLPWPELFAEFFRVLKPTGNLVLHCSVPFNYTLIRAAPRPPTYSWYWRKNISTGFLFSKKQPMRCVEEILVWKMKHGAYYPQYTGQPKVIPAKKGRDSNYFGGGTVANTEPVAVPGDSMRHFFDMSIAIDGFSTRPADLIDTIVKSYTKEGDTVLDFTCYKGISGVRCKALGRRWIGIDKNFLPSLLMV